jgi:hypothetical protein
LQAFRVETPHDFLDNTEFERMRDVFICDLNTIDREITSAFVYKTYKALCGRLSRYQANYNRSGQNEEEENVISAGIERSLCSRPGFAARICKI